MYPSVVATVGSTDVVAVTGATRNVAVRIMLHKGKEHYCTKPMATRKKNTENNLVIEELQKDHHGMFTIWCIPDTVVITMMMMKIRTTSVKLAFLASVMERKTKLWPMSALRTGVLQLR